MKKVENRKLKAKIRTKPEKMSQKIKEIYQLSKRILKAIERSQQKKVEPRNHSEIRKISGNTSCSCIDFV